jgi:hypothetical protein
MLRHIVGRVPGKWLRVDDEPWLPPGLQDVACVQIGSQQHILRRGAGQLVEKAQTFTDQPFVRPTVDIGPCLVAPVLHQV